MRKPIITDVFGYLVNNVKANLLPVLQETYPAIQDINYQYGPLYEIIETLGSMNGTSLAPKKYPIVMLITDPTEEGGKQPYGIAVPRIIIATGTQRTWKAAKRIEENYKPILYPIFEALLEEIAYSRYFMIADIDDISYTKKDRLYVGAESKAGNTATTLPDTLDAIEFIPRIPLDLNKCSFPINPS